MKSEANSKTIGLTQNDIAASYQKAIIEALISKSVLAVKETGVHTLVIAGGVAANKRLRTMATETLDDCRILYPELPLCTDNAAMIAYLGEKYLAMGNSSAIDFPIFPNLTLA
jgi:N6-L-threonylcarbamoyladenine synthase